MASSGRADESGNKEHETNREHRAGTRAERRASKLFEPAQIRYDETGLVPAVIQDARSHRVLMVAYMNRESLEKTLATGLTWFYSRSRGRLWQKGETSGHVQRVREILVDCDQDTLLVRVAQAGEGACHEGFESCFHYGVAGASDLTHLPESTFDADAVYSGVSKAGVSKAGASKADALNDGVLAGLYDVIASRKEQPVEGSYTSYLFAEGLDKILKKVGEESTEVLIAAKGRDGDSLVSESADLIYHLLVLMVESGVRPEDVWAELATRRGGGGSEDAPPGK